jgi:hypothetical protein
MNLKPEELVKALRYCSNDYPCKTCPVELQKDESTCIGVLFKHCIDQIERDQKEIAELKAKVEQYRALIPSWVIPMTPKEDNHEN